MIDYLGLTRAFGIISLVISLGFLFNLRHYEGMAKKMVGEPSGFIMGGIFPVLVGGIITQLSHDTMHGWAIALTVIGWVLFMVGVFRIWFVEIWIKLLKKYIDFVPVLFALFGLIFAIMLLFVGYIMPLYH